MGVRLESAGLRLAIPLIPFAVDRGPAEGLAECCRPHILWLCRPLESAMAHSGVWRRPHALGVDDLDSG